MRSHLLAWCASIHVLACTCVFRTDTHEALTEVVTGVRLNRRAAPR